MVDVVYNHCSVYLKDHIATQVSQTTVIMKPGLFIHTQGSADDTVW